MKTILTILILSATWLHAADVTLSWTNRTYGVQSNAVYYSTTSDGLDSVDCAVDWIAETNNYTVTNLDLGKYYWFSVVAKGAEESSAKSTNVNCHTRIIPALVTISNMHTVQFVAYSTDTSGAITNLSYFFSESGDYPTNILYGIYYKEIAGFDTNVGINYQWNGGRAHYLSPNLPPEFGAPVSIPADEPFQATNTSYYLLLDGGSVPEPGSYTGNLIRYYPPIATWSVSIPTNFGVSIDSWGLLSSTEYYNRSIAYVTNIWETQTNIAQFELVTGDGKVGSANTMNVLH